MKKYKQWLKQTAMSRKLVPTQIITFCMVLLMACLSIWSLFTVNSMSNRLIDTNVQNSEDLNSIIETMYLCRVTGRDILLQENEELRMDLYANYLGYFDSLDQQMDDFLGKLEGDRRSVFASIIISKDQYKESMILSADLKNEGGKDDEALAALRSVTPVATEFFGDIAVFLDEEKVLMNNVVDENNQTVITVSILGGAIGLFVVLVLFILIKTFERSMNEQLHSLQSIVSDIVSTGDTSIEVPQELLTDDEVGAIAKEMKELTQMLVVYSSITNSLAQKNYKVSVPIKSPKDTLSISLDSMVLSNNNVLQDIMSTAKQVSVESQSVFTNAQTLEDGVTQQASSIESLSSQLANITAEIQDTAESAKSSVSLATQMSTDIDTIDERVQSMMQAMEKISKFSNEISRIITTIEDISFQTNILALNAAVEAARAGSAGKGFAVVADEVRNLANKSSEAAKQTAVLIENSVNAVTYGEEIAHSVAQALVSVLSGAQNISGSIQSIDHSTAKQITSIDAIHQEVNQITQVIQANQGNSIESTQISTKLNTYVEGMIGLISDFTLNPTARDRQQNSLGTARGLDRR